MWVGFESIESPLLLDLIKGRTSGELCLFGLLSDDVAPYDSSGPAKVLVWNRLRQVMVGDEVPWKRLVVLKYKSLRELADDVAVGTRGNPCSRGC